MNNDSNLFSQCCGMSETTFYNAETSVCGECRQNTTYGPEQFDELDHSSRVEQADSDAVNSLIAKSAAYLAIACVAAYAAGFLTAAGELFYR